jgi:ABC-2 type transport system permease protein
MHNVLMVIRREYLDRVRKKSFWIGTLVFPLIMVLFVVGPLALAMLSSGAPKKVAVVDSTGRLFEPMQTEMKSRAAAEKDEEQEKKPEAESQEGIVLESVPLRGTVEATYAALKPRVNKDDLYAVVTIGDDLESDTNFHYYGRNVGDPRTQQRLESALERAVTLLRLERADLKTDPETLRKAMKGIEFETFQVSASGTDSKKGFMEAYFGTFLFVFMLYMTLLLYGIAVMRGILEEKSNRVMEVLLGSLSPQELMTGKILGVGLVGLTQVGIYVITALVLPLLVPGAGGAMASVLDALNPVRMLWFLVFFVIGYFMYTALFAAVGAVCNSEQEAQNLQSPVIMCLVIPMVATFFFVSQPDSTIARVVSLVPLFTPMVMVMRINTLTPPLWEILLSIVLTVGFTWLLFRGVAKIFRIGILMYGKRPTVPEILRWARS